MRKIAGIDAPQGRTPDHSEYLYRKNWMKHHIDNNATNLVFDEKTKFPVRAEYHYPAADIEDAIERVFNIEKGK